MSLYSKPAKEAAISQIILTEAYGFVEGVDFADISIRPNNVALDCYYANMLLAANPSAVPQHRKFERINSADPR